MGGGDAEQRSERCMPGTTAVEAEYELVEIGLEVTAAQAMIDAQGPDLEVGKDPVAPRQDKVGSHLPDDMRIMAHPGGAGIPRPSVSLGRGAWGEVGRDKSM